MSYVLLVRQVLQLFSSVVIKFLLSYSPSTTFSPVTIEDTLKQAYMLRAAIPISGKDWSLLAHPGLSDLDRFSSMQNS